MRIRIITVACVLGLAAPLLRADNAGRAGVDWPQFRGIGATGVSEGRPMPAVWPRCSGSGGFVPCWPNWNQGRCQVRRVRQQVNAARSWHLTPRT